MAAVLVCLLVIMLIGATLVRGMLLHHRQTKQESQRLQAMWLSEAGAALAVARLRNDSEYAGETWRADISDDVETVGVVEIVVRRDAASPEQRTIQIKATFPEDPVRRAVLEHEINVTLSPPGDTE